jgi:hypothetical protein
MTTVKKFTDTIVSVLTSLSGTVKWLCENRVVRPSDIPESHVEDLKKLQLLGLVHRDGAGRFVVQKERLARLLVRGHSGCSEYDIQSCLSAYRTLIRLPNIESIGAGATSTGKLVVEAERA